MNASYDVACVGLIAANIPIRPVSKAAFDVDVTLVDRMDITPGGDALNQAIILSRLGRKVLLSGKIGTDVFGGILSEQIRSGGVDMSAVVVDENVGTSTCAILISDDGSRRFLSCRHASERFSPDEIDLSMVLDARILSIGSLLAMPLLYGAAAAKILEAARKRGCVTAADTKHDSYRIGWAGIRECMPHMDYFLPSYDEAAFLSGESDPGEAAGFFLDAGARNVVIKLGAQGCYARSAGFARRIPGFATETVDTTGAGDNFVAGFLSAVLQGWDFEKCCRYANAVGAISVGKVGSTAGVENGEQVDLFIRRAENDNPAIGR